MRHNFTRRTVILSGTATIALSSVAGAQTMLMPSFEEAVTSASGMDWATPEAERGGLSLVAQFDSSGSDNTPSDLHHLGKLRQ